MNRLTAALMMLAIFSFGCAGHFYELDGEALHVYLKNSDAQSVSFACSRDGFRLHPADKINDTTWEVIVPATDEFTYFYMIDGKPFLPACRLTEQDDFGSKNCIFAPQM